MKALRLALLTLSIFGLFYSCQKEKSFETGGGGAVNTDWEFKEDKLYKGKVDTAYIEDFGTAVKSLFLEGTSSDGKQTLSIQVIAFDPTAAATYSSPQVLFQYLGSTASVYANDPTASGDFTVVITKIDSISVSGTFTGKVKDTANAVKTILDGKFSAKLKNTTTPPPPPQNGQLVFWAKSSCTAGGNISIKLSNNQTGTITSFTPTEPNCGAAGSANFTLPAGNYTWKANCGSQDSTSGQITVVGNQCVKQEVLFGVAATTDCHISDNALYEFITNTPIYTTRITYTNKVVTNIKLIDSLNLIVDNDFNITYPSGKVQINSDQYFLVDGSGKVTEFHGLDDPAFDTTKRVIMRYTYDGSGYMTQYTKEYVDTPGQIKLKGVLTWSNGNLTKIAENNPSNPAAVKTETTFDYYTNIVKNFISELPLAEITYFQTAVNSGKNSLNAAKTETYKEIDPTSGTTLRTSITNYDLYTIDPGANPYVRSFRASPVGGSFTFKVVLSYNCF